MNLLLPPAGPREVGFASGSERKTPARKESTHHSPRKGCRSPVCIEMGDVTLRFRALQEDFSRVSLEIISVHCGDTGFFLERGDGEVRLFLRRMKEFGIHQIKVDGVSLTAGASA